MSNDDDANRRYEDIMRRLAQRKRQQASAPKLSELAEALDSLNAAGLLASIKRRPPPGLSAFGPATFNGLVTTIASLLAARDGESLGPFHWTGTLLWHKPKGYYHYQTLGLLGVWALETHDSINIIAAEKSLTFNQPLFNPESYYHHIKHRFDLFYEGDAAPPPITAPVLLNVGYDPAQRLAVREALENALRGWVSTHS